MSGKEIIDKAAAETGGVWKASPGLVYPMLGRLIEERLIDQIDDGRYKIMMKGLEMIKDLESVLVYICNRIDRFSLYAKITKLHKSGV